MNFILKIYVPSTLNVAAQYTEVLTVTLDLTPDISKQPTLHDQVLKYKTQKSFWFLKKFMTKNKKHKLC